MGTFLSGMGTAAPVLGFLATRALRRLTLNLPNPLISILLPLIRALDMAFRKASKTMAVSVLVNPVTPATSSTRSALVMLYPPSAQ